jgi:hypothetical protein
MSPSGTANCIWFVSACTEKTREMIGWHRLRPMLSFVTIPGRISASIPRRRMPVSTEPPATPPFSSSISAPGLFTLKERITIRRGSEVKSRRGIGMRLTMYSFTTSMLYLRSARWAMTLQPCPRGQVSECENARGLQHTPFTNAEMLF